MRGPRCLVSEVNKKSERYSVIGAVDKEGMACYQVFQDSVRADDFVYFMTNLESFLEIKNVDLKKTVFFCDNEPTHRSQIAQKHVLERLNVLFLPPYSPQQNLIERVWQVWKMGMRKTNYETTEELLESLAIVIRGKTKNFFIRNFLKSSSFLRRAFEKDKNFFGLK